MQKKTGEVVVQVLAGDLRRAARAVQLEFRDALHKMQCNSMFK